VTAEDTTRPEVFYFCVTIYVLFECDSKGRIYTVNSIMFFKVPACYFERPLCRYALQCYNDFEE